MIDKKRTLNVYVFWNRGTVPFLLFSSAEREPEELKRGGELCSDETSDFSMTR